MYTMQSGMTLSVANEGNCAMLHLLFLNGLPIGTLSFESSGASSHT